MICLGLFISVVGNPYSIVAYRVDDVFNMQLVLPFKQAMKVRIRVMSSIDCSHVVEAALA